MRTLGAPQAFHGETHCLSWTWDTLRVTLACRPHASTFLWALCCLLRCYRCASSLGLCHPRTPAAARHRTGSPPPTSCFPCSPKHAAINASAGQCWGWAEKRAFSNRLEHTHYSMLLPHKTLGWMVHTQKGPCEDQGDTEQCARAEVDVRVKGGASLCSMASAWGREQRSLAKMRERWRGCSAAETYKYSRLLIHMTMCGEEWMLLFSTAHLLYPRQSWAGLQLWYLPDNRFLEFSIQAKVPRWRLGLAYCLFQSLRAQGSLQVQQCSQSCSLIWLSPLLELSFPREGLQQRTCVLRQELALCTLPFHTDSHICSSSLGPSLGLCWQSVM